MVLDGPMTGQAFLAYLEQVLILTLRPDDIVVMDNLPAHKVAPVRAALATAGAQCFLLPPYSPDMNPIEMAFCCARPQSEPATASGNASATCSTSSHPKNAPTTSEPQATETQSENALVAIVLLLVFLVFLLFSFRQGTDRVNATVVKVGDGATCDSQLAGRPWPERADSGRSRHHYRAARVDPTRTNLHVPAMPQQMGQ
jgi:hypothetical protein